MPRGGRRPGAGRKSNNQVHALRAIIASRIHEEDWAGLTELLLKHARRGSIKATQLLFSYYFGDPYAAPIIPDKPAVRVIEFIDPTRPDPPPDS